MEEHVNPHVLRHLCDLAEEKMTAGDSDCLRIARLCCRIAARLDTKEARTLGFGRLASALRLVGRLNHSERALAIAFSEAPEYLHGYLMRFRCYLRLYQKRFEEAEADAEKAVELTTGAEHARSVGALGSALAYSGQPQAAIRAHEQCLAETDPDSIQAYCNAIHNYATSLVQGSADDVQKALKLCAEARSRLNRRHKMQRAKLWWTTGLLHLRSGDQRAAWSALDTARRSLVALKAAPEVAAIVADMARVDPEPVAIQHICQEASQVITGRHPLTRPLRTLARAARQAIPEAAAALREEAAKHTPCLVV